MRASSLFFASSLLLGVACSKDRDFSSSDASGTGAQAGAAGSGGAAGENGSGGKLGSGGEKGSGGATSVAPSIVTTELSPAQLNQRYSVLLEAEGGTGTLTWDVAEGSLPAGLSLSKEGRLSGSPRVAGTFTFTLAVEDERGERSTREVTLVVGRKDWLVYRSDKAQRFLTRLYAVRLSSALMPVMEISGGALPSTARVHSMLFSPDGTKLAFVADTLTENVYDVYLVNMGAQAPSKPKALGFALTNPNKLSFSPNGTRLAHSSYGDVRVIDLGADTPEVLHLGEGNHAYWVSDTQLAFVRPATPNVSLMRVDWPEDDEPGAPQSLPVSAFCFGATCRDYFQAHPELGIYEFGAMDPSGGMTTRNVLFSATDTAWSTLHSDVPPVSPLSPDFKLGIKYATSTAIGIVELPSQDANKSLADVTRLTRWANTSHQLLVASTGGKFQLVDAEAETLTPVDIPGGYGPPNSTRCPHRFAPNDSWVALYDEAGAVYLSRLRATPGEAVQVGARGVSGVFSPDSRFYAFAGDPTNTGAIDLSLVDLSSGTPVAAVRQNERHDTETEWDVQAPNTGPCSAHASFHQDTFFFSPNSSHLAHIVREGTGSSYLYVTNLLDAATGDLAEGRKGVNVTGTITCDYVCDSGTCTHYCGTTESDFVFQP